MANESTTFVLSDKVYNTGKKLVQVVIPAFSALYFGLGTIWGFPATDKVCGSLALLCVFLGTLLGISNSHYRNSGAAYDGTVQVVSNEEGSAAHFYVDPHDLVDKKSVTLKVSPPEL